VIKKKSCKLLQNFAQRHFCPRVLTTISGAFRELCFVKHKMTVRAQRNGSIVLNNNITELMIENNLILLKNC